MQTSARGFDLIRRWEGLVLHVYADIGTRRTIGYGHLLKPGEVFDETITKDAAEILLRADVIPCEKSIAQNITSPLTQNQFDALVSWLFNVGAHRLDTSNVKAAINEGRFADVPAVLQQWCKVQINGVLVQNAGVLARRKSESTLFMTPDEEHEAADVCLTDAEKTQVLGLVAKSLGDLVIELDPGPDDLPDTPRNV